jgi:hypothetical protein
LMIGARGGLTAEAGYSQSMSMPSNPTGCSSSAF